MTHFDDKSVNLKVLRERAYNYRWAEVADDVIPLTAADSDFPVAPEVIGAIREYLDAGYLSYTPKMGFPRFREIIAQTLQSRKGENVNHELVLPIDSAARGMYVIAQSMLKPGDEMLVFDPVDYLFKESALAAGAIPTLFPAKIGKNGRIDLSELERYITPKTKMIGLCNPHNPLGCVYSVEELEHIMSLAEKYDLWIMNDEIWSDIVFPEQPFVSILSLGEERNKRTLSVYGFSKSFGVAGLRIGCIYCQDESSFEKIVKESAVMTTAGGISSLSQVAGIACLEKGFPWLDEFLAHLTSNRDYALERISKMVNIKCRQPQATFLLFPDIRETGMKSEEFTAFLEKNVRLCIIPGSEKFFGPGSEGHVRICFATSRGILTQGLDRLEKGLEMLN